ncbi:CQS_1a_G0008730.mRNA.1.CDS.1 [Saccharomyces cerevisiae]|nr:CQS_1a_G0008730.mRNA.1.CDS.1 [Saccharomyces cerevisiae]CAI5246357.1 ALI_HP2_G0008800.mRNA.1.CDS.1 [Saccharomyces cerevisiae]CAI6424894.1 ALI_HP2_G0008800.mRNA.1.CDS.1 [Saccharomyces cerevisiae]CAI6429700.1 ALI_HP1_G0009290.mRNA.1.CDS.1 [Saccharomyces cerevisiae]CAI6559964.1 ALI_collapsed_G0010100.mRNA.1.CDS.1 [Saccharomyces cerevisiae]
MRAYGKRGPVLRTPFRSNKGLSSSSDVEFSDDDVNSVIPDVSSTISSSIADHPIEGLLDEPRKAQDSSSSFDGTNEKPSSQLDSKRNDQNVKIITSSDTSMAFMKDEKLSAFNFLDGSKASKRKRRRTYQKHDANITSSIEPDVQDEDSITMHNEFESIRKIYNDINEFILKLPRADDDILNKMLENEMKMDDAIENNSIRTSKDKKYGKFRTILINKNKENEIMGEEVDQKANTLSLNNADNSNAEKEGLTSNHYNELKNMGDTIKYQDDIEFLLSNSKSNDNTTVPINEYFKKLLNLSLMIINDEEFFQYAKRYFKKEIIKLSFAQFRSDFPELILLQGYLLHKVSESQSDFPPSFDNFSIELSKDDGKIRTKKNKHIKKLSHLNFEDFLRKTQFKTGLYYSLSLWEMHGNLSLNIIKRISILASNKDLFSRHVKTFIPLLEKLITASEFCHMYIEQPEMFDSLISNLNNQFKDMLDDDSLIKILILLTNMEVHNYTLWKEADMIFQSSMNTILESIHPLTDAKVDNILLHLGLCLNICSRENSRLKLDGKLWYDMKTIFVKMIRDGSDTENRLVQGLFYLNFSFLIKQRKENSNLDPGELNLLLVELEAFKSETSQFNEGISNKIEIALNYLKSIYTSERITI